MLNEKINIYKKINWKLNRIENVPKSLYSSLRSQTWALERKKSKFAARNKTIKQTLNFHFITFYNFYNSIWIYYYVCVCVSVTVWASRLQYQVECGLFSVFFKHLFISFFCKFIYRIRKLLCHPTTNRPQQQ